MSNFKDICRTVVYSGFYRPFGSIMITASKITKKECVTVQETHEEGVPLKALNQFQGVIDGRCKSYSKNTQFPRFQCVSANLQNYFEEEFKSSYAAY